MITIIDNFLEDTTSLDWLYDFFRLTGTYQFDFMPHSYINKKSKQALADHHVSNIIKELCASNIKYVAKGYEAWVNVLTMGEDHLHYHVDCDEEAEGIVPAKMTATLYLGPSEGMEGGDLAINTTPYINNSTFKYKTIYDLKKDIDNDWLVIPYKYNRLVMFDSNYPHAVLPITNLPMQESRISLNISAWDKTIRVQK